MAKPKLRFPEFTNDWEQRKFDEVFDCTIPNNTLSRAELNYESGSVRNIHYGDILIKYGSVVDVQNDEIPFATGKSSDDFKGALLQDGDIIIADTAEDETTGKACEIGNSQGLDVVSGLHTMVCRPRNKMALGYLGYYLNSDAYHHQLLPLMQGIKVLSLSRTNVQKTMVCYPKSKAEQQLIADCFRNLDNLITLHQREVEALEKQKKAVMQKIFSQQIRFKKDDGTDYPEWEVAKLKNILTEYHEKCEKDGTYEHISLTTEGVVPKSERYERDQLVTHEDKKYRVTHIDDICYNPANLKFGVIARNKYKDGIFSPIYVTFRVNNGYLPEFVEALVTRRDFIQFALKFQQGTVFERMSVSSADLLEISIKAPCLEEQQKIADLLYEMDNAIDIAKQELEKWKLLKKGLLQQMFV